MIDMDAVYENDPTECPKCHEHERHEIDVEKRGAYLDYIYACQACGHVWTITEKMEE